MAMFLAYAVQLKYKNLFFIVIGLFFADLLTPDFIPLIDEIILGILAIILGNWKKERQAGRLIEGETIRDHEEKEKN